MSELLGIIPKSEQKAAVPLWIAFVPDYGQPTLEGGFKGISVFTLECSCEAALLGVLLPLVDGVGDRDALEDLPGLRLAAQQICYVTGA